MTNISDILPSFKNLTLEILEELQRNILVSNESTNKTIENWAEKLLRYCELYHQVDLYKNAKKKWKNYKTIKKNINDIVIFLFNYYKISHDIRFLNVVLKLSDKHWIVLSKSFYEEIETELTILAKG